MSLVLNSTESSFQGALENLSKDAASLSVAVSYVQLSGWKLFREITASIPPNKVRLVFTDQLDITQPRAIKAAMQSGANVRRFEGGVTFHPKVFVAYGASGKPYRYLVGSANLSHSALTKSVEVGVVGSELETLKNLDAWFGKIYSELSTQVSEADLDEMEDRWKKAAALRVTQNTRNRRTAKKVKGAKLSKKAAAKVTAEHSLDSEILEELMTLIPEEITTLGFDLAGNTVRQLKTARTVLAKWLSLIHI